MKILNLYAGIGGNRKLWGDTHEITAVEIDPKIASIYHDFFPQDRVLVEDAHAYLLAHFEEYDFIWSSPPCPTHSQIGRLRAFNKHNQATGQYSPPRYPDMNLYSEILLLQGYFKGKWVVENVISWYTPLIVPTEIQRHWFWANFLIRKIKVADDNVARGKVVQWEKTTGFDLSKYSNINKRLILRNCVNPQLGLHLLNEALNVKEIIGNQLTLSP